MSNPASIAAFLAFFVAPVCFSAPDEFISFDFENSKIEYGFDEWFYSGRGENPCGVYNGESQSKLCGPYGQKIYAYYSTYNTYHMGWGRYGYIDSSSSFAVRNSSLKVQTTGGPRPGPNGTVIYSGYPSRAKSDIDSDTIFSSPSQELFPGDIPLYFKTQSNTTRFEQLQGKNRFNVWVLMPRDSVDITQYRKSKKQRPDQRISWYPFINTSTSSHYYHHSSNIPLGGWTKIQFDAHPTHNNSGSKNRYSAFSTGGYQYPGDDRAYFSNITTFALRFKAMINQPMFSAYFVDEITTEYKPYENEETINNIGIGYDPETHFFDVSFEDKYRCPQGCESKYEIRYAFEPITNSNFYEAILPKYVLNFERSRSNSEGVVYKPNSGYNLLWAGIEIQDEDKLRLQDYTKLYFAIKDISNRTLDQQPIDFEEVQLPGVGVFKRTELIKTIEYEIIPVNYPLQNETSNINEMVVGHYFEQVMQAFGGRKPYVFEAISLPEGLTLSADGLLSGTPTLKQATELSYLIHDEDNKTVSTVFNVEVFEEEDFDVVQCGDIVDLKHSIDESIINDSRFNRIETDKYTSFVDTGTTIVIGSNKQYDFTSITGSGYDLWPGDKIRTEWSNHGNKAINFQPNISVTQSGRIIYSDQSQWFRSTELELLPGVTASSEWVVEFPLSAYLINVNSNFANNKSLVLNKIQLVENARPLTDICRREF